MSAFAQTALFNITSASYGTGASAGIPAGIGGVVLELGGTLPSATQQASPGYLACFYTGYGSQSGFPLSAPDGTGTEPLTVPASTIQAIPNAQFTAADGYAVTAYVYFVAAGGTCDGTFDAAITNRFPVRVVAPSLGAYSGVASIPQTNSAINVQAPPLTLTLPANGILPANSTAGATTIQFGAVGTVTPLATSSTSALLIPVPASFSSAAPGTTASLSVCNTFGANAVCTTPDPAITLTVTALTASSGTLTLTPTPVNAAGQTVLAAQFTKAAGETGLAGAPAGNVTFTADGATVPAAPLVLDTTATFAAQTSAITTPAAPTPTITPAAGSYLGAQTITIADTAPGAVIYYTQDGSVPNAGSTLYGAPFTISTSQTIKAIATVAGSLNSAVASVAYTVTVRPPTHLAFQVQPVTTALNTTITPPVQVALLDATGAVASGSSAPVTLALQANPGQSTLAGTKTVNAVNGIATFNNLSLNNLGTGYTLAASSGSLAGAVSSAFNITPPPITMKVQSELVGIGATLTGSFTLGVAAPTGGLTVNLSSGTPANVTISPATVTVAAGQTTGNFTYTGVAAGDSTLSASATGYQTGTVLTTATAAQVSLGAIPNVAPAQMQSIALSLATAAPAGGTTVTFTIANPNIATVTQTSFIPAGQFTPAANPQVTGILIGTTTVTANAPGYAPATRPVVVTVVASINPATTNINLATSTNTLLQISAPAPPGGIVFSLASDDPTIATVPATVTLVKGATSANIPITGIKDGTTTIRATSPGVAEADGTVNVTSKIQNQTFTTGYDLQFQSSFYLPVSPSNPTTVTITSNDPTVAVVSTSQNTAGRTALTFPNTTSTYIGTIWIQALKVGSTTLTISAPGYTSGTVTINVDRTGFAVYYNQGYSTTTFTTPQATYLYPVPLNADGSIYSFFGYYINPTSAAISIPITSATTSVGTVTSPATFHPVDTQSSFTFQPVGAGSSVVSLGAPPAGFAVPTSNQSLTITVTTPAITVSTQTTAVHLMNSLGIGLPVAPPSGHPVTVTVTSSDPTIFTVSNSPTVVGTASTTYTNVSGSYPGTLYIQGQKAGSATLTVSAPGYTSGSNTITVQPSGFYMYYPATSFSTTTFSSPTQLNIYASGLDPSTLNLSYSNLPISPGVAPITVSLTNSTASVGTISPSSVTFGPGDSTHNVSFQPAAAGTDTVTLVTPTGFSTPAQYQSVTATVTAPAIQVGNLETGVHLQNQMGIYLPVAPPSGHPVTVTVTSSNAGTAVLSTSATAAGTGTVTFTNVTSSYVGLVYIQGKVTGNITLTESAPGYTSGTSTVTVDTSGFTFYYSRPPFTTTTFSSATTVPVYTTSLSNGNVVNLGLPLSPDAAPVTITVTDSAPSVGTISPAALVFAPGDSSHQFNFQPVSAGTATLAFATPAGYSTGQFVSGDVTVTAPAITVSNTLTGVHLEQALGIYLPVAPPNPVTVTVSTPGPLISTLSSSATTAGVSAGGKSTIVFTNVTSTYVGTIYVQGQGLGSTTVTVSAPGYTDGQGNITVNPSGFAYYGNQSDTLNAPGGSPTQRTVYPWILSPGTLTLYNNVYGPNPDVGNVNVTITSADPAVASVTPSPLVFNSTVGYVNASIQPVASGSTTINLGTPAGFSTPSQGQSDAVTVP